MAIFKVSESSLVTLSVTPQFLIILKALFELNSK